MTELSDTQLMILTAAAQQPDSVALPLPASLRGGAAAKVGSAMIAKGLIEEVDVSQIKGGPIWRGTSERQGVTLVAIDLGLAAIGVEREDSHRTPVVATEAPTEAAAPVTRTKPSAPPKARTAREGTKQATLIAILRAAEGATIEKIMAATGWQSHTVHGAMAGALKKKLGLKVESEKVEGRGLVYRLPAP